MGISLALRRAVSVAVAESLQHYEATMQPFDAVSDSDVPPWLLLGPSDRSGLAIGAPSPLAGVPYSRHCSSITVRCWALAVLQHSVRAFSPVV